MKKKEDLNKYKFSTKDGFNSVLLKLRYEHLGKYFRGESCLELGCSDGEGTKILIKSFKHILAVDGSSKFIKIAKNEIKSNKVKFLVSNFENLEIKEKFDTIVLAHILEHVDNPVQILKIAKRFLSNDGVIIVDVPNAYSLHRQVGLAMGMIRDEHDLNDADKSIGHKRVYDMDLLSKDIQKSGLKIKKTGGVFLKPLSNSQMERIINKKSIEAFNTVGVKYPDIAAEIFIIAGVK